MKNFIKVLSLLAMLLLVLTACGGDVPEADPETPANNVAEEPAPPEENEVEEPAEEPVEPTPEPTPVPVLEDSLGNTWSLDAFPQRILSLAPSVTEILFAIGAGDQLVGREDFAYYPEEALALPSIGMTYGELNLEAILDLEPDLVLIAPLTSPEQIDALKGVGLTLFLLDNPADLNGMYELLRSAATLTGHEDQAETLIASLQDRVAAVESVIASAESNPVVFYELDSTDENAPYTTGPGTFVDALITMAGGVNIAADLEGAWVQLSSEELIARNPEIILLGDAAWGVTVESVVARPGYDAIDAVSNGQVFPFNDDLASRPGPRLVDGLEEMAKLLHPELFN